MTKAKLNFYTEKISNICDAIFYGFLAYAMGSDFFATGRLSSLVVLGLESVVVVFFLIRDMPKKTSLEPYDWFIALMATVIPLFLRPAAVVHDMPLLIGIQVTGSLVSATLYESHLNPMTMFLSPSYLLPNGKRLKRLQYLKDQVWSKVR